MKRIVNPGWTLIRNWQAPVFCKIEYTDGRLSITGEGPAFGQIQNGWRPLVHLTAGWTRELESQFLEVWRRWHLNDLHAECEHQRALGWTWTTHPSAVCPECGYKLGSAWLKEAVPDEVIAFLASLPETTVTPDWV